MYTSILHNTDVESLGAVVTYYNNLTESNLTWSQFAMQEVLSPLNMTHSFFGAIPIELLPYVGVPGGPNWADLIVGLGYDPAAGMWVRYPIPVNYTTTSLI